MSKQSKDPYEKVRRDFEQVNPYTKVFEDKRIKRARKYPKKVIENLMAEYEKDQAYYEENENEYEDYE